MVAKKTSPSINVASCSWLFVPGQVSLGKERELLAADYNADKLPPGVHSVKGMGKIAPDPQQTHVM